MNNYSLEAKSLFNEGTRLISEGDDVAAENAFRKAIQLAPDLAEAHANLGLLLDQQGHYNKAESFYRRAIELMPGQMQIHLNFGAMLVKQKRFSEAEAAYREALALDPQYPGTWSNLGVLLACMKREVEAEKCYRSAMALSPGHCNALFNLAYLLLRQGRYEEGWRCLEARDWYAPLENYLRLPRWQGESLEGKSLLIGYEAGHGDMIQFCRYATLIKKVGAAQVSILCHPGLKTLFTSLLGVDEVIAFNEPLPKHNWDYWVPPLSLPVQFSTRLDTIPADLPYLNAEPAKIRHWAGIMGCQKKELRIGLVWKGNPRFENDADRSLVSLDDLASLGEVAGVRYYSLQKGPGEDEAATPPYPLSLMDLGSRIADFSDTAAIMMNLDLVISVDTAAAHLAGSLGKPCWVLLPEYKTDWRWLTNHRDSPWYPDVVRLFRQKEVGDWATVIAEVKAELQALS
jgi:Flp pilus assembly protein TadD